MIRPILEGLATTKLNKVPSSGLTTGVKWCCHNISSLDKKSR